MEFSIGLTLYRARRGTLFESMGRRAVFCLLLLGLSGSVTAQAQGRKDGVNPESPVPIELFFQQAVVLEAKLSPSGRQLAITTSHNSQRVGLVVMDLSAGEGGKARRVALFTDVDVERFYWVGEDRLLFSVVDLAAGSGEDLYLADGLFSVKADGSQMRQLIRREQTPFFADSRDRDLSLDRSHILLSVPKQQTGVAVDEVVVGHMKWRGREFKSIEPLWLNTRTGRTHSIEIDAPANAHEWWFDSKGQARLVLTQDDGQEALYWRSPGESKWQLLTQYKMLHAPFRPLEVDDVGNLYVLASDGPEGYAKLSTYDFAKGAVRQPALVSTPGFDFNGSLILDRAGTRALGVRVDTDGEQTVWFDVGMKGLQALVDQHLPSTINRVSCRRCGEPDMVVLVRSFSDRNPGQLWLYEAADQRWQAISPVLPGIDPGRMASVDMQRIKARDGHELPVWLTLPIGQSLAKPGRPSPAVVLVHGGPWTRIGYWQWRPMEQFLASRGYLVISPEFRGSTGYGEAHFTAGWKQWGQAMQDDVADALLWAQQKGLASERACIAGASYGGYSTLMGLVRDPQLYRCGVAWVAVTDPFLFLEGSWRVHDDISQVGRAHTLPQMVGDVNDPKDVAMLTAASPVAQAKRIKAPLLLGFGEVDRRVPLAHGERLRQALIEAGRPPEWVSYANEGHSWRQTRTEIDWARRVEAFLAQHLLRTKDGP